MIRSQETLVETNQWDIFFVPNYRQLQESYTLIPIHISELLLAIIAWSHYNIAFNNNDAIRDFRCNFYFFSDMMTKRVNPGNSMLYSLTTVVAKQFTVFLSTHLFDPRINRPTTGVCLLRAIKRNKGKIVEFKDNPKRWESQPGYSDHWTY